jgi:hypothetical protein
MHRGQHHAALKACLLLFTRPHCWAVRCVAFHVRVLLMENRTWPPCQSYLPIKDRWISSYSRTGKQRADGRLWLPFLHCNTALSIIMAKDFVRLADMLA